MEDSVNRFIEAQASDYYIAKSELLAGRKRSHWMWYIFPQLRGLGNSTMATYYGIGSRQEAERFLAHPILGGRLRELIRILIESLEGDAVSIFGNIDALKLKSSLTLFDAIEPNSDFEALLKKFYQGERDHLTLERLKDMP